MPTNPHPPAYIDAALPKTVALQVRVSHPQNQPVHQSPPEPICTNIPELLVVLIF